MKRVHFFVTVLSPTAKKQQRVFPFFPLFNSDLIFPTLFSAAELPVVLATVEQKLIELTTLTNLEGKCDFSFVTISATGKKLEIIHVLMI